MFVVEFPRISSSFDWCSIDVKKKGRGKTLQERNSSIFVLSFEKLFPPSLTDLAKDLS